MLPPVPFHGRYQAGILPEPQRQTAVISFTATADGRAELTDLFRTITARARFLTAGGTPPPVGIGAPPSDSGVLGPAVTPDGLTVTVGVGSTLFDDRYGLASQQPAKLTADDARSPTTTWTRPSAAATWCSSSARATPDTVVHALRDIARHTRGGMQVCGASTDSPARPGPSGTVPRNMLGFMDGISNPDTAAGRRWTAWSGSSRAPPDEPAWTAGGSYFVVRLIRMFVEFWDRVDITEQENMIGRRRATGYPLDAQQHRRHAELRAGPDRRGHPAHRAHAAGQPADPADAPPAASCAAATTTTAASTRSATWTSGWSSLASSRT